MAKKATVAAVVLFAIGLAGGAAWVAGAFEPGAHGAPRAGPVVTGDVRGTPELQAPALASSPAAPSEPSAAKTNDSPSKPARAALDAPISPGKGSVVGRVRFRDGTPMGDVPLSLWGYTSQVDRTDADGRFHLHDEWVAERSLYVKEADFSVGLVHVRMVADQRVEVDATIDRGVDVEGRVVAAETLAPLEGVSIAVRRPEAQWAQGGFAFAKTDAAGRYRFRYLSAVPYTMEANLPGYEPTVRTIDLSSGPWPERFELPRARTLVLRLEGVRSEAIGKVLSWSMARVGSTLRAEGRATVRADGEARIEAPMPGRYWLRIEKSDATPQFNDQVEVTENLAPITVPMGLAVGRLSGVLRYGDGEPLAGATVSWNDARTTTDAEGRFEMPRVAAGSQPLWIVDDRGSSTALQRVEVVPGAEVSVSPRCSRSVVEGRVTIAGAAPGTTAYMLVQGEGEMVMAALPRPDETGRFRVRHLPAGRYRVIVSAGDARSELREVTVAGDAPIDVGTVDLRPYERVPLRVDVSDGSRPGVVSVRAYDGTNPSLAARVIVGRTPLMVLNPFVARDDQGWWLRGLPPGSYRLVFEAEGYTAAETTEIEPGQTRPIDVRLVRK